MSLVIGNNGHHDMPCTPQRLETGDQNVPGAIALGYALSSEQANGWSHAKGVNSLALAQPKRKPEFEGLDAGTEFGEPPLRSATSVPNSTSAHGSANITTRSSHDASESYLEVGQGSEGITPSSEESRAHPEAGPSDASQSPFETEPSNAVINHSGSYDEPKAHPEASDSDANATPRYSASTSQPEAGPSSAVAGPYSFRTSDSRRRSRVYLDNSTTSFIDVTEEIEDMSPYPVSLGGFCDIYTARMRGEGRVALKMLRTLGNSEKAKKRFQYEAEIWFRIDHPNVLKFFGICTRGEIMYMVSPWQDNGHLSDYLKAHPNTDRLRLLYQVADALDHLHNRDPKIIHGDIKGLNILVSPKGDALVCDFGLSMVLSEIAIISGIPTGVNNGGSTRYMANELVVAGMSKTEASDTYAFAMLMIEVLTGFPPFKDLQSDAAVISALIGGNRPSSPFPPELQASPFCAEQRLWRLMQVCWHRDPTLRPTMSIVKACLMMIVHDSTGPQNSPGFRVTSSPAYKFVMENKDLHAKDAESIGWRPSIPSVVIFFLTVDAMVLACSAAQICVLSISLSDLTNRSGFRLIIHVIGLVLVALNILLVEIPRSAFFIQYCYSLRALDRGRSHYPFGGHRSLRWVMKWLHVIPVISCILSLSNALLITISSRSARFHRPDSGGIATLLIVYEVLCWVVWLLESLPLIRRYYFTVARATKRWARKARDRNARQMDGLASPQGVGDIEELSQNVPRGEGDNNDDAKQNQLEKPTTRPEPTQRRLSQGSLDGERNHWPHLSLRLQSSVPASSAPPEEGAVGSSLMLSGSKRMFTGTSEQQNDAGATSLPLTVQPHVVPRPPPPAHIRRRGPGVVFDVSESESTPRHSAEHDTTNQEEVLSARQRAKRPVRAPDG